MAEVTRRTPEVVECHRVTGEDCYYLRVTVRDVEHLEPGRGPALPDPG